jgi:hypothetical protein
MTTITWVIEWMNASTTEINGFTEVVLTAGWRCNGTDGTFSGTAYGSSSFPQPETGGSFTPYAQLTQDQVLNWCWANNNVNKSDVEKNVTGQLEALVNPPVIQPPLPWSNT